MSNSARGRAASVSKPAVPESTYIRQRYLVGRALARLLRRAALQRQVQIRRTLVSHREVIERIQRAREVRAGGQLERVESAAREIEQLIALDIAYRAQLAAELVALAKQLR